MKVSATTDIAQRRMLEFLSNYAAPMVKDREMGLNAKRGLEEMREQGILQIVIVENGGEKDWLLQLTPVGWSIVAAIRNGVFEESWDSVTVDIEIDDKDIIKPT